VALDDLSRQTAVWDDQRSNLRAAADQAMANLADAQGELDSRAETILVQEAQLSDQVASVADLTDRADALAVSVSDLRGELDTVLADAARLGRDLDDRDAALVAASDQVADLTATRDAAQAVLSRIQDELAAAQAEGDRLASGLAVAKSALAAADEALTQERADWKAKADATTQVLADLTVAQSSLEGQVADLTGQLADTTIARDLSAAQVADLTEALTVLEGDLADATAARDQSASQAGNLAAAQAALEGRLAYLTSQLADQAAARTTAEVALASAEASAVQAATGADAAAKLATEQLLAAQTNFAALVAERDDLTARLSVQISRADDLEAIKGDRSLAESDIRTDHASVTRQLAEAQAELTELDTACATALEEAAIVQAALTEAHAQGLAAGDRAAALQSERDALAEQVATMQGDAAMIVQGLTDRLTQAEVEVARLNADLAARAMADGMPAPADDAFVLAINPTVRPKARASANLALATQTRYEAVNAPPKAAVRVATAAPVVPQPSSSDRVAPASDARQLKGCQFQWVGKEGRLVYP
jgi:chromosome segregation ATPase